MAKVTVSFDRRVTRDGYYLKASILPYPDTDPVSLESCLLVNTRGSNDIVRCATLLDYEKYILVNQPIIYLTSMGNFNALAVGDVIRFITIPAVWEEAGLTAPYEVTVASADFALSYGCVSVVPPMGLTELPGGFSSDQTIVVLRGGVEFISQITYPIVCGSYPDEMAFPVSSEGVSQIYSFRTESVTVFPTVETAINMYESIRAQTQALVDEANTSGTSFPATSQEVFE